MNRVWDHLMNLRLKETDSILSHPSYLLIINSQSEILIAFISSIKSLSFIRNILKA